jgi:glycosyltransferase involved in cell wall biosynthesis
MSQSDTMFLLPAMRAAPTAGGGFVLTQKFVQGATEYARQWPGPVVVLVEPSPETDGNLDPVEVFPGDVAFGLEALPRDPAMLAARLRGGAVVLASLVQNHIRLGRLCETLGVPLVVYTEYSLRTRQQIVRVQTRSPLLRLRRNRWERGLERRMRDVIRGAAGLQCNGTPTFDAYRELNPRTLLYFDTRVRESMLVTEEHLADRADERRHSLPIRLAFSGRLNAIAGVEQLPAVASELRRLGVWFTMDICGGGELEPRLRYLINQRNVMDVVRLRGVLDFEKELVPFISGGVDLFVCCHRQGEPSCTYLETMSCGVPIVGYDNEAFAGVVRASGVGWLTPMDEPTLLANKIAELAHDRPLLIASARAARAFAAQHTFERTMESRISHLMQCCGMERGAELPVVAAAT